MTIGLSPKLYPSAIAIATGLLVAALVDKTAGLAIVGTGVASLGLGHQAGAGNVVSQIGTPSDDLLELPPDAG